MKNSAIQWTDHTFNGWFGCRKVAPECDNCYITDTAPLRLRGMKHGNARIRTSKSYWKQPFAWNKKSICGNCGHLYDWDSIGFICGECNQRTIRRQRVFCLSLGDWLDEEVPIEWLADLLWLIQQCPNLDWQLLTKRPQNFNARMDAARTWLQTETATEYRYERDEWLRRWINEAPRSNVWIGVSAGADLKAALEIPAKIHFLSCEPMLYALTVHHPEPFNTLVRFDWIIFGGESGKNARPLTVDWIRTGLAFCGANKIAAFVKQTGRNVVDRNDAGFEGDSGEWPMDTQTRDLDSGYQGAPVRVLLKNSHGGDMSEWPEDLRVREFPTT